MNESEASVSASVMSVLTWTEMEMVASVSISASIASLNQA